MSRPRPTSPRLPPLDPASLDAETQRYVPADALNIFRTLAHHPKLLKRWMVFANHVLAKSTLPERERELVILRIGWRCRAEYEFGQHTVLGHKAGLTDAEIVAIAQPLRTTRGPRTIARCSMLPTSFTTISASRSQPGRRSSRSGATSRCST